MISVLIGLLVAFGGLITGYALDGGSVTNLGKISPFLMVVGGTVGGLIASYGLQGVAGAFKAFFASLSKKNAPDPTYLITKLCKMSDECRQGGLLKLQSMLDDPDLDKPQYLLLKEGMILAMDMNTADQIQESLEADMKASNAKKQMEIDVFDGAVGLSPTLGIIGTVMGLVLVLGNMEDAAELAASIATAFIATLYGVSFANLIYLPMANQLKGALKRDKIFKMIIVDGICMIAKGENSRNMANKLSLYYQAFPNCEKKYRDGINN